MRFRLSILFLFSILPSTTLFSAGCAQKTNTPEAALRVDSYATYDYGVGDAAKIVDFGTLPGLLQLTLASEVLMHDRVLQRQLAAEGWKIREHRFTAGVAMIPYTDGRLDFAMMGDFPAIKLMRNKRFSAIAATMIGQCSLIAKKRITPDELRGMRIAYTPGTSLEYGLAVIRKTVGISAKEIKPFFFVSGAMKKPFESGKVDAVVELEPNISTILAHVPDSEIVANTPMRGYLLADDKFAARHPQQAKAVYAALLRMARWAEFSEANQLTALGWIREANIRINGVSDIEENFWWLSILKRETFNNGNYPLLPPDSISESGVLFKEYSYMKEAGILDAAASWADIGGQLRFDALTDILREDSKWELNRFDYARENLYAAM